MNQPAVPDVSPATLEVVPLGGVGEFGMNMMAVSWEDTTILIDAGVMFPEPDQLGVDLIIPDLTYVEARGDKVKALVLTHGHEDHIGAVPHVLALFADSTNIDRRGFTGPEIEVIDAFEELFTSTQGKLVVATFSSSIYRMQVLVDLAAQFDRKVAFVGRSIVQNAEIAQRLGYLRIPSGVQIRDADVPNYASQDVLCVATGSQGEPQAALPRIAVDDHRWVKLGPDDTVVLSARAIPGHEK